MFLFSQIITILFEVDLHFKKVLYKNNVYI